MSRVLVASSDEHGRFVVMLTMARALRDRGHEVSMLSGSSVRPAVRAAGLGVVELRSDSGVLDEAGNAEGTASRRRTLTQTLRTGRHDVVLADVVLADVALAEVALGTALPASSPVGGSRRVSVLGVEVDPWCPGPGHRGSSADVDLLFRLAPPSLGHPREAQHGSVRSLGPLRQGRGYRAALPPWWGDVEETRPVVHVTQGRDGGGADLERLVVPTVRALADEQVLVVVTTGPHSTSTLHSHFRGALPANVRVAEWLPDDQLMPHLAALVTDGSPGVVMAALRHGVPLVVAADNPQRAATAARVARSGAGLRLRTGRRHPFVIRHAVRQVLDDNRYWAAARRVQAELGGLDDPLEVIDAVVHRLTPPRDPTAQTLATPGDAADGAAALAASRLVPVSS